MTATAEKSDPKLWEKVKSRVTKSSKGGKPGQWSARKAQMATQEYKKEGGGYEGKKSSDNHLKEWTDEEWGTKSGKESGKTGERYLPKKARKSLSKDEYARSTAKKRADSAKGKQFSKQPKDVAKKAAAARRSGAARRSSGPTKAELMERARARNVPGRSKMSKAELQKAVA
ncbi:MULTISPECIES: hypothetical protein [Methylobacterium]|uniref:DUF5872 domain-containing protein n=1 Tax=Methylobacterium jeotgali TaxID=381630 RepID=A0ABQ4SNQ8_9HYPH|nr:MULTISPECIES: hypothetical protein [Methylobacterium]PIU05085.1 MAG: hypothetical protein COT56_16575 [Methylobacterium sp. CG09_land_8_20_14_0_10_71_15]PIU11301.1 MAG: hypothetical protein COT28_20625 [Methylobacterium sp. CG08_land_8_20_14_0_20_71_15]GBU18510.1 hypothetical protein AwMethylo_27250 [Methylobacterium sp.]GJE04722.1 hypothetical protein AOPFMNJM_0012 [Methylobacterium jeotgali]